MTFGSIRKRMGTTAAVVALTLTTAAAAFAQGEGTAETGPYAEEQVHVTIPGMEGSCTLLWISDMHICSYPDDPDVDEGHAAEAKERSQLLRNSQGVSSLDNWKRLSAGIDAYGARCVVLGADMIDYASAANLDALGQGLADLDSDWIYIRADHDYGRWYGKMGIKKMRSLHRALAPQDPVWVRRYDEFTLVGLDNTTSALSEEALAEFTALCEEGTPIVLCTHVPIDQPPQARENAQDASLASLSAEGWGGRVLCWGDGDEYDTGRCDTMAELTDLIFAPGSPVAAVLSGHLHQSWEGSLTDTCIEHVFSAAYEDHIGVITLSG